MNLYVITKCVQGDAKYIYYRDKYTAQKAFEAFVSSAIEKYGEDFEGKDLHACLEQNDYMDATWDKWLHFEEVKTQD